MKKIIVINHKSDLSLEKAKTYPIEINDSIRNDELVIICPSAPYIPYFKGKYNFKIASQNISESSITGELTGLLLKSLEIKYTLINTNDRKNKYEEKGSSINKKIESAIKNSITPIVTIGETYYEKELNKTLEVITRQIKEYFQNIEIKNDIIICYTPNWTFKNKQIPSTEYIKEVIELIKSIISRKYNTNIKVIYGGEINKNNLPELEKIKVIDGYLIENKNIELENIKQIFNILE